MRAQLTKEQQALLAIFSQLKKKDRVFLLAVAEGILQKRKAANAAKETSHA